MVHPKRMSTFRYQVPGQRQSLRLLLISQLLEIHHRKVVTTQMPHLLVAQVRRCAAIHAEIVSRPTVGHIDDGITKGGRDVVFDLLLVDYYCSKLVL